MLNGTGPQQLKDWIERRGFNQASAADYLGWDFTYVSRLVNGKRNPDLDNAIKIERLTGIPVEAWAVEDLDDRPGFKAKKAS